MQGRAGNNNKVAAEAAVLFRARRSGIHGYETVPACRYAVHKQMLKAPLLDTSVPEDKLADWIHARTMRVHGFLDKQVCCCWFAGPCTITGPAMPLSSMACIGCQPGNNCSC